jgi:hypothetical protein
VGLPEHRLGKKSFDAEVRVWCRSSKKGLDRERKDWCRFEEHLLKTPYNSKSPEEQYLHCLWAFSLSSLFTLSPVLMEF